VARFVCGGLTTFDMAYYADVLPARGHKGTAARSYQDVGGPAANAAVTAALLGSTAELHSVIGTGPLREQAIGRLSEYGVGVVDHEPDIDLPVASVWIDGTGERTIISTDNRRSEVEGNEELVNLGGAAAVLLDGHYPRLQMLLAAAAVEAGVPIVLDCGRWRPVFADLLPVATDVIMTRTFRSPSLDATPVAQAVLTMREDYGCEMVAASRGSEPIVVADESGLVEIPVPAVAVVDTTGAGDVLHGAYLHYRYTEGLDARAALAAAAVIAANSCTAFGARQLI
jgi:sugar/nucleoside kinase (ribokinase family)